MRICINAAGVPITRGRRWVPAGTRQDSDIDLRQPDLKIALLRDANVARQVNSNPPPIAVPEIAAITGLASLRQGALRWRSCRECRGYLRTIAVRNSSASHPG
jgi:hypothetical protein